MIFNGRDHAVAFPLLYPPPYDGGGGYEWFRNPVASAVHSSSMAPAGIDLPARLYQPPAFIWSPSTRCR